MPRNLAYARPKDTKATFKKLVSYLGRHTWELLAVAVLVTIAALSNLIGTYSIKYVVNEAYENKDGQKLALLCLWVGLIYLAGALSSFGYTQIIARLAQKVIYEMRKEMFEHIQDLPLKYFDTHSFGNIMSVFTNDIDSVSDALNNAFASLIQYFVEIVGTMIFIFVLDWKLSLIVFAFYILMFAYIIMAGKKSKHYYRLQQETLGELSGFADEIIRGQKTVKVFNHEEAALAQFKEKSARLKKSSISALTYSNTMVPMVMALSYVNYAIVAIVGGLMAYNGQLDLGTISAYLVFVRQTAMPINRFTGQANVLLNSLAAAERIFQIIGEKPESDLGQVTLARVEISKDGSFTESTERTGLWAWKKVESGKVTYTKLCGDVRFKDVVFAYREGHTILNSISLYAKPGQKIALVGSTGAGKTTITNLINRFYDIQSGQITFDGINIQDIKKDDLRKSLGMVLQDTHLFTGTIEDNIRYGKLDATSDEVVKAAELANADSFIRRLPQGYKTLLTADGANLSQGQRQLLAIARAAISDPPVLILDEATSSIDTHTEHLIQEGMDKLMKGRTVFVIAHRLSTVRNANAIIVLEHGRIIERGDHEDLLKQKGRYYSLYTGQAELS
jgi:ATP-binding cassette subfamily B multidrug efflux pump